MDLITTSFFFSLSESVAYGPLVFFLAKYLPYLILFLMLFALWKTKDGGAQLMLAASLFLSALLSKGVFVELVRFFYDRPRPFLSLEIVPVIESFGPSFPSGHASFFFALSFVFLIIPLFNKDFSFLKKWGWLFVFLSAVNGVARVAAGAHWMTDVLGGMLIAFLSVFIVLELIRTAVSRMKFATEQSA